MRTQKVISTVCLSVVFWLLAAWAEAWRHHAKTRSDCADAGLVAALLLVALGVLLLRFGSKVGYGHEAARDAVRFARIVLITGVACGLAALGFRL